MKLKRKINSSSDEVSLTITLPRKVWLTFFIEAGRLPKNINYHKRWLQALENIRDAAIPDIIPVMKKKKLKRKEN